MTEQEREEFKRDMRQEMLQDSYEEMKMRTDFEYACESLGLFYLHKEIEELADKLCDYGYDVSTQDVIDILMEV